MTAAATELLDALAAEAEAAQGRGIGTRARLLHAAAETIEEGGYGAASVAAISARAGVAAGTLYRHFPSKAELCVELFRRAAEQELGAMHAAAAGQKTNLAKLDAVLAPTPPGRSPAGGLPGRSSTSRSIRSSTSRGSRTAATTARGWPS